MRTPRDTFGEEELAHKGACTWKDHLIGAWARFESCRKAVGTCAPRKHYRCFHLHTRGTRPAHKRKNLTDFTVSGLESGHWD